jgi:hypothetical protein
LTEPANVSPNQLATGAQRASDFAARTVARAVFLSL